MCVRGCVCVCVCIFVYVCVYVGMRVRVIVGVRACVCTISSPLAVTTKRTFAMRQAGTNLQTHTDALVKM